MLDKKVLGSKIKQVRKNKNMRQDDLAIKSNLSRTYICDIENGRYSPSLQSLLKISDALEVQLNELVSPESEVS